MSNPRLLLPVDTGDLDLLPPSLSPPGDSKTYALQRNHLGGGYLASPVPRDPELDEAVRTFYLDSEVGIDPACLANMLALFSYIATAYRTEVSTRLVALDDDPRQLRILLPYQSVGPAHCLVDLEQPMLDLGTGEVVNYTDDRFSVCGSIHSHVQMDPSPSLTDDRNELGDSGLHLIAGSFQPSKAQWTVTATVVHDGARHVLDPTLVLPRDMILGDSFFHGASPRCLLAGADPGIVDPAIADTWSAFVFVETPCYLPVRPEGDADALALTLQDESAYWQDFGNHFQSPSWAKPSAAWDDYPATWGLRNDECPVTLPRYANNLLELLNKFQDFCDFEAAGNPVIAQASDSAADLAHLLSSMLSLQFNAADIIDEPCL